MCFCFNYDFIHFADTIYFWDLSGFFFLLYWPASYSVPEVILQVKLLSWFSSLVYPKSPKARTNICIFKCQPWKWFQLKMVRFPITNNRQMTMPWHQPKLHCKPWTWILKWFHLLPYKYFWTISRFAKE